MVPRRRGGRQLRDPSVCGWFEASIRTLCEHAEMTPHMGRRISIKLAEETGDVPGWVLITLMTAGLVIIIWGLAGPALSGVFQQAIERVVGF
jgi:hypothetical protein